VNRAGRSGFARVCATGQKAGRTLPLVSSNNTLVRGLVLHSTSQQLSLLHTKPRRHLSEATRCGRGRRDSTLALLDSNGFLHNGRRTTLHRLKYLQPRDPSALTSNMPVNSSDNTISTGQCFKAGERSPNTLRLAARVTRLVSNLVPLFLGSTLYQYRSWLESSHSCLKD
jgi:hypothetical protein